MTNTNRPPTSPTGQTLTHYLSVAIDLVIDLS